MKKHVALSYTVPFLCAFLATFYLEVMNHRTLSGALLFLLRTPHLFLLNMLLLAMLYVPMLALRRKTFWAMTVSTVIVAIGITNFVLQSLRVTPFEGTDLYILTTGFDIISFYLTPFLIGLIIVGLAAAVFVLGILFVKLKKHTARLRGCVVTFLSLTLTIILLATGFRATGVLPDRFPNLVDAYREYGFTYCFLGSIFDRGIDEPEEYSEQMMQSIMQSVGLDQPESVPSELPNVIFVQLESFFDPHRMTGMTFSENPIPNFTALMQNGASGYLAVPSIGAGTANTEFEVISGMDLASFGAGEYPYKTILRENPCESVPYVLSRIGYGTHAIHNNRATFYGRDVVFSNFGFDTFTPIEYMPTLREEDFNALGWAKDTVLTEEILSSLASTEGSDYVYAISVQGHGGYPSKTVEGGQTIRVTGGLSFEDEICAWEYYLSQLYEMDRFVAELVEAVNALEEKTVVVFFGDHLPGGLGIESAESEGPSVYHTEYAVHANFDLALGDENLEAFQLASVVLDAIGIEAGNIIRTHQNIRNDKDYLSKLESIEYDILYGDRFVYENRENPYETKELVFGSREISISSVSFDGYTVRVTGEGFTLFSRITVDGEVLETTLEADGSLTAEFSDEIDIGDAVTVAQYTNEDTFLGETEAYPCQ